MRNSTTPASISSFLRIAGAHDVRRAPAQFAGGVAVVGGRRNPLHYLPDEIALECLKQTPRYRRRRSTRPPRTPRCNSPGAAAGVSYHDIELALRPICDLEFLADRQTFQMRQKPAAPAQLPSVQQSPVRQAVAPATPGPAVRPVHAAPQHRDPQGGGLAGRRPRHACGQKMPRICWQLSLLMSPGGGGGGGGGGLSPSQMFWATLPCPK
jgi:hypothetical protein